MLAVCVRQLLAAGLPVLSDHAPHPVREGGAAGPEPVRGLRWDLLFQGESLWMKSVSLCVSQRCTTDQAAAARMMVMMMMMKKMKNGLGHKA